jgi:hypothetical protein
LENREPFCIFSFSSVLVCASDAIVSTWVPA